MNPLITTALIGTAQTPTADISTVPPIDELAEGIKAASLEQTILLKAGVWACYQQAGKEAETLSFSIEPAPAEELPVCSAAVASLMEHLFQGKHQPLLPEALERLQKARQRLPCTMLPAALDMNDKELQPLIFSVLGKRGIWLSTFNPQWSWVQKYLEGDEEHLPADAETIWQEGNLDQRLAVLRRVRTLDPSRARTWLETVWKQEKAAARADLLAVLETKLSSDDEAFLEKALDDRSGEVRTRAASFLAKIPGSAFIQRMQERATTFLNYEAGTFTLTPPTTLPQEWKRDGLAEKGPEHLGEKAHLIKQLITPIPPTYWEMRFGMSPRQLLMAARSFEFGTVLIEAWADAATFHQTESWIIELWQWCVASVQSQATKSEHYMRQRLEQSVARYLVPQLEQRMSELEPGSQEWRYTLLRLPRPWSERIGRAYIDQLHTAITVLTFSDSNAVHYNHMYMTIAETATALPESVLPYALERLQNLTIPAPDNSRHSWQQQYWQKALKEYVETLRIRQRIIKEIQ